MTRLFRPVAAAVALAAGPVTAQVPAKVDDAPKPYEAKLIHAPTPVPDRVILTWNGDPATSMAVTWRTDTSVAKAVAQIAVATDGPEFDPIAGKPPVQPTDKVKTLDAKTTALKSDLSDAYYHSVAFTGLTPKSKYVYRVGDRRNWSEWHQFETASDKPEPIGFIYFGDAQNDIKRHWSRVVRGAYSDMPKARFILHAGDLVNRPNSDGEWGEWHTAAGWINGTVPSLPTPGNHEYGPPPGTPANPPAGTPRPRPQLSGHWKPTFTLPENGPAGFEETAYYIDVQGVRIVSLNSNEKQKDQVTWLEGVLKNNPCRWTVVTFHHPVYSTAATRQKEEEGKSVRQLWRPVLDKFPPDLVLQGHDHSYGRSGLMLADNVLDGVQAVSEKGTVYCVSVSGPKMYELGKQPWMVQSGQKKQLYQLICIDGDKLSYVSYTAAAVKYDEFELRKRKDGTNELVERAALEAERARLGRADGEVGNDPNTPAYALGGLGAATVLLWLGRLLLRSHAPAIG